MSMPHAGADEILVVDEDGWVSVEPGANVIPPRPSDPLGDLQHTIHTQHPKIDRDLNGALLARIIADWVDRWYARKPEADA